MADARKHYELLAATPNAVLLEDMDCVECGYNLRGLKTGGKCPECGKPVRESIKPPPELADLSDELSTLSWTYLVLFALVATCAIPVGLQVGWIGPIFIGAALGFRYLALHRLRSTLRQIGRVGSLDVLRGLMMLTLIEVAAMAGLLILLTFGDIAVGTTGHYLAVSLIAVWIVPMFIGLLLAGRAVILLRRSLSMPSGEKLMNAQAVLTVTAMVLLGAVFATAMTTSPPAGVLVLIGLPAGVALLAAAFLLFVSLQFMSQNIDLAAPKPVKTSDDGEVLAVPGRGLVVVREGGDVDEPEPAEDLPPIPLVDDDEDEKRARRSSPAIRHSGRRDSSSDDDDPMAHL